MTNKTLGILPCQTIRKMLANCEIDAAIDAFPIEIDQVQPASIDLRLGQYAYPVDTSFLPSAKFTVLEKMQMLDTQATDFKIDLSNGAVLEKGRVYVVPLLEKISLPPNVAAFANPKSSTGRLDILTRLIADYATIFDQVEAGYEGNLYIEIAPRSFSIVAKTGTRLNQLRFRKTSAEHIENSNEISQEEWKNLLHTGQLVNENNYTKNKKLLEKSGMLPFTVDLMGAGNEGEIIGYRARKHASRIDLERRNYNSKDFWEAIYYHPTKSLILDPDEFYILMTKEAIAVPPAYAAEMIPYDTRAGEFRVHYAGFFDPNFGYDLITKKAGSSRGVLEVRSHEVPFLLEHGQIVGWLRYEKMAEIPDILYGQEIKSNYQGNNNDNCC
jgi:dCTP deaminase